jgi:hypothetical protein
MGQVHHAMPPHPTLHPYPWLQFGGVPFVLATVRANAWLTALPWWVTSFALVAALVGTRNTAPVLRVTIVVYLTVFALVGHPFNWYWGWVPGMLFPLAWARVEPRRLFTDPGVSWTLISKRGNG